MIKSVDFFVLLLVLITHLSDVNAGCLDIDSDWKCNPRDYRSCPNTYKCSKSEGFKCCQYKIEKDMPNCKNMWMKYEEVPWGCRGGGSRPCPSSYKCRTGPGNLYSLCCEYITCEHPPGYIHPKEDGKWYDIDGCTVCECISQDNHQCKLTTKCMKKRTCKATTSPITFAEEGKCVQCTCDTSRRKMTCEDMCCKNYGPTKKLTNEDCKECTSCSQYSEDPPELPKEEDFHDYLEFQSTTTIAPTTTTITTTTSTETKAPITTRATTTTREAPTSTTIDSTTKTEDEIIIEDNGDCIKLYRRMQSPCSCKNNDNITEIDVGGSCYECMCTKGALKNCVLCIEHTRTTSEHTPTTDMTSTSSVIDTTTETVSNRRINDKTGDCIYSHEIMLQRPCPCEHENEKTKIEINENCYKCQCTDGVLKNCTQCLCGKNQKGMDFMDNGKCVACRCNKENKQAECVQCPNKDSSKLCKLCKEGETEGRNQHLTLKKASFLISIIFTNCIRVSSRE
ncbi:unnamed protein product [Owenia fusiformis]|uniref:Uncharacterized protein n=1 Tax=Owenia fusiformis TaxID=6347 RepID=A0A8J1TY19_OWEFU|nr:unnamed protein product [Owenia fusiformis]